MDYSTKKAVGHLTDALGAVARGDHTQATKYAQDAVVVLAALSANKAVPIDELATPTPFGYDTTLNFLRRTSGYGEQLIEEARGEEGGLVAFNSAAEMELAKRTLAEGRAVVTVAACEALAQLGVANCLAFPIHILRMHFEL